MINKNIIIVLCFVAFLSVNVAAMSNPSAVYCEEMGYNFEIQNTADGEKGICVVDNEHKFGAWEFFQGKVGKEYSYCTKHGYDIMTASDGKSPYSKDYAVCISKEPVYKKLKRFIQGSFDKPNKIPMTELMNLDEKINCEEKRLYINKKLEIKKSFTSDFSNSEKQSLASQSSELPSYFDWRDNNGNWMTSVKNQGACGSCWAFSAVGAVEAQIKIDSNNLSDIDLSEQQMVSCASKGGCGGGGATGALRYIKDNGIVDEECFPYQAIDARGCTGHSCGYEPVYCNKTCPDWQDRLRFIKSWEKIGDSSWYDYNFSKNRYLTKKALIERGPLVTGIEMSGNFGEDNIYRCGSNPGNDHIVVIIGYNDTGDIPTSYWIVKNSWGSNWADDGYFKVGWDGFYPGYEFFDQCGILDYRPLAVQSCISHNYSKCYDNDVYWYDSCGNRQEKKEECGDAGCRNGVCKILSSPCQVSNIKTPSFAQAVDVQEDYAYVASGFAGLQIVNISDAFSPEIIGSYNPYKGITATDVKVAGDLAYLAYSGLEILNISDPTEPKKIGGYYCITPLAIAVSGDYAYVSTQDHGLKIIDVSNPYSPELISTYPATVFDMFVSGDYLYMAVVGNNGGLHILNISNKTSPELIGSYSHEWLEGFELSVLDNKVYLAALNSGIFIIDVSNKTSPKLIRQIPTRTGVRGFAASIYADKNYLYAGVNNQISSPEFNATTALQVFDISKNYEEIGYYEYTPSNNFVPDIYVQEDYAYVANEYNGLQIMSIWGDCAEYQQTANPKNDEIQNTRCLAISITNNENKINASDTENASDNKLSKKNKKRFTSSSHIKNKKSKKSFEDINIPVLTDNKNNSNINPLINLTQFDNSKKITIIEKLQKIIRKFIQGVFG